MTDIALGAYANVPDFIYGITREIWEDRGIGGRLDAYYAVDINVRAPTGVTHGNSGVVAQTLGTLHQFPDRQLVGEDVIWTPTGGTAFLSSHRLISVMRHTGDGVLGPATGRCVRSRIIADCWVQDGVVKEEWLARDQAAFAHCLGLTPRGLAEAQIARGEAQWFTPADDRASRYTPTIADDPEVADYIAGLTRLWNTKDPSVIRTLYHAGATLHAPGGETRHGHQDIDAWAIGWLASFPAAGWRVESAIVNHDPGLATRVALRWSLEGVHDGWGHFGQPSGRPVHIMGFSHAELWQRRIRTEWMVADEVSVWKQLLA